MYTLYACLTLNKSIGVVPECVYLEVPTNPVTGTLANLVPAQFISILGLYYALMLPSGNDAACVLAFYYGGWLVTKKTFLGHQKSTKKELLGDKTKYYQLYIKKFVQFMNNNIVKQELHHTSTHF
jgi:D-alanyl-D-alanine carboxypeptidase